MEDKEQINNQEGEINIVMEEKTKKDFLLPLSIIVAAVMITGAIVFMTLYKGGSAPVGATNNIAGASTTEAGVVPITASTTTLLAIGPRDAILGNKNASVTIVEYGDYQCPFCVQYFQKIEPQIVKNYLDTGKAKMIFRNFAFLGPESTVAAEAAECAEDQNQLWPYHDALYNAKLADFNKGGAEDDGVLNRALFLSIAAQLHLNIGVFTSCIDSNKYASLVAQEKNDATTIGINSTPATLVNGELLTDGSGSSVGANAAAVVTAIAAAVGK